MATMVDWFRSSRPLLVTRCVLPWLAQVRDFVPYELPAALLRGPVGLPVASSMRGVDGALLLQRPPPVARVRCSEAPCGNRSGPGLLSSDMASELSGRNRPRSDETSDMAGETAEDASVAAMTAQVVLGRLGVTHTNCPSPCPLPMPRPTAVHGSADVTQAAAALVKAMLLRAALGGMACDVHLLRNYARLWLARFLAGDRGCSTSARANPTADGAALIDGLNNGPTALGATAAAGAGAPQPWLRFIREVHAGRSSLTNGAISNPITARSAALLPDQPHDKLGHGDGLAFPASVGPQNSDIHGPVKSWPTLPCDDSPCGPSLADQARQQRCLDSPVVADRPCGPSCACAPSGPVALQLPLLLPLMPPEAVDHHVSDVVQSLVALPAGSRAGRRLRAAAAAARVAPVQPSPSGGGGGTACDAKTAAALQEAM
jgi:hypothetical protein